MSVFWAMPPMLLGGTAAAAGIALINAIGNLGGFFGPSIMGSLRDVTGGYSGGLLVLAGALILEAILVSILKLPDAPSKTPAIAERSPRSVVRGPSQRGLAFLRTSAAPPSRRWVLSAAPGVVRWPVIFYRRARR